MAAAFLGAYHRDELDFHRHLDYLHWNPVKHGCAKNPRDWPYSTIHRFVDQGFIRLIGAALKYPIIGDGVNGV